MPAPQLRHLVTQTEVLRSWTSTLGSEHRRGAAAVNPDWPAGRPCPTRRRTRWTSDPKSAKSCGMTCRRSPASRRGRGIATQLCRPLEYKLLTGHRCGPMRLRKRGGCRGSRPAGGTCLDAKQRGYWICMPASFNDRYEDRVRPRRARAQVPTSRRQPRLPGAPDPDQGGRHLALVRCLELLQPRLVPDSHATEGRVTRGVSRNPCR